MPSTQEPNTPSDKTKKIADLNNNFRRFLTGGQIVITQGIQALTKDQQIAVLRGVTNFSAFNEDNDPHQERDFGAFDIDGIKIFWKIDYYDLTLTYHSPDATDPKQTRRVLTIMKSEEY
jgi:Protein of unknown function (DUF3768)